MSKVNNQFSYLLLLMLFWFSFASPQLVTVLTEYEEPGELFYLIGLELLFGSRINKIIISCKRFYSPCCRRPGPIFNGVFST